MVIGKGSNKKGYGMTTIKVYLQKGESLFDAICRAAHAAAASGAESYEVLCSSCHEPITKDSDNKVYCGCVRIAEMLWLKSDSLKGGDA